MLCRTVYIYICINCEASSARSLERPKSNESFPHIVGLIKEVDIFLHSVDKNQDAFGIFTNWFRQEFDLPVASLDVKRNFRRTLNVRL